MKLPSVFRVTLSETVTIPPNSEIIVQGKINDKSNNLTHAIVQPTSSQLSNRGILIAKTLVDVHTGELPVRLANTSNDSQKIYSGTLAAQCEPVEVIANDFEGPSQNYGRLMPAPNEQDSVPVHLKDLFDSSKTLLSETETIALNELLVKHADAFSKYKGDIGRCTLIEPRINTGNNPPIKQAPRRLSLVKREAATAEIKKMLENDIIEPSKSPWSAPITLVKKKDSSYRFCIDYRHIASA